MAIVSIFWIRIKQPFDRLTDGHVCNHKQNEKTDICDWASEPVWLWLGIAVLRVGAAELLGKTGEESSRHVRHLHLLGPANALTLLRLYGGHHTQ